ncbi:uncharacterized protein LOC111901496 [Lactuca sativa]|uniref:uncharacterized protein LOC111901496 n=1 Tax=Lactuca sativa TaxID=4236 RepID=UPI000CD9C042|nr:uncharacterized protein LOC111901496 [Lactuca sativa]
MIAQIPEYKKFLKDLPRNWKKLEQASEVTLNEQCSIVTKMKDLSSLIIPCRFGNSKKTNALSDFGASINLMSYSFYKKLNLSYLNPTRMDIHMANRSITYPQGIIKDLLVKVDKFVFPVDFGVLNMEEDVHIPIILRIPFLSTARALVDIHDLKLSLQVGTDDITFGVNQTKKTLQSTGDKVKLMMQKEESKENKEHFEDGKPMKEEKQRKVEQHSPQRSEDETVSWSKETFRSEFEEFSPPRYHQSDNHDVAHMFSNLQNYISAFPTPKSLKNFTDFRAERKQNVVGIPMPVWNIMRRFISSVRKKLKSIWECK